MLKFYFYACGVIFLFFNGQTHAQEFQAVLSGNHQPVPALTAAMGSVSATLNGDTLSLSGDFSNIITGVDTSIAGGAHIHEAIAGRNGSVKYVLKPTLSQGLNEGMFEVASNTFVLDDAAQTALMERRLYINVHSKQFQGGEIRGQILPEADEVYSANLFGSNQTTSVMSNASGAILLERTGNTVTVTGSFQLSSPLATSIAGGIHIHQGLAGRNGPVLQPLTVELAADGISAEINAADNTYTFTDEEIANLQNEGWYVNVHSEQWTGGEIRGQLTPLATAKFRTNLSGANQLPPVVSWAGGKLALGVRGSNLTVSGSFAGLESDLNVAIAGGAHIHMEMAGRNGPVIFPLNVTLDSSSRNGTFDPAMNTFALGGDTLAALMSRGMYVNVHTLENGGGEIRGQILPESNYFLQAYLSGSQQPNPVLTNADGAVIVEVLADSITVSGTFNNLSSALAINIANGAHIHMAPVGSSGQVFYPLTPTAGDDDMNGRWNAADNKYGVAFSRKDSLRARLGYINVHSDNFNGGEVRGQLMHEATAYFYTPLSGAEQTPAVTSAGSGAVMMEYNGSTAVVVGSFAGLSSALAAQIRGGSHLHNALPGSGGPILTDLAVTQSDDLNAGIYEASNNIYEVSSGWMDTVRQRMTYVNIHSADFTGGEIRGQMRPLARNYYAANLRGKNSSVPVRTTAQGLVLVEQNGPAITAYGSFSGLTGDFATEIAGGAHIHRGMPGMNGGIMQGLSSVVDDNQRGAQFLADSNSYTLPDSSMMRLIAGNSYVNIHSATYNGGEIRGQVLHEINMAPNPTVFTEPASGDTIVIEEDGLDTEFAARWESSTDPNDNKVVYVWQLSVSSSFDSAAIAINTGESTEFVTTLGAVDTLLSGLGIDSGTVKIYHRVVASDGSLCSEATMDSVVIMKGTSTAINENPYISEAFALYPSPTQDRIQLDIQMKQRAQGELQIVDLSGKVIQQSQTVLFQGANLIRQDVSQLGSGIYIARLVIDRGVAVSKQFVKH